MLSGVALLFYFTQASELIFTSHDKYYQKQYCEYEA
jgi:hypothetical protein